ncbi:MAG: hypothetical protein H6529_09805 [Nocardioides sp.]|nr:hypothetical protein [Nocardioidaceae bacterium]MCB8956760.1 hypothetical protein [Nocardioides sp.]
MIEALVLAAGITAHAPEHVQVDSRIPVHGVVRTTDERRPVRLQEHTVDGWATMASGTSRRTGRFGFDISSGHAITTRVLRVVAPRDGRLRAVRTPVFRVRVDPPSHPAPGAASLPSSA